MTTDSTRPPPLRLGPEGRIARVPTPTGLGVGDINSYVILSEAGIFIDGAAENLGIFQESTNTNISGGLGFTGSRR